VLARHASASHFVGPEPFLGVGTMMIQREIHLWDTKEQFRLWTNSTACRQAEQLVKHPRKDLIKNALGLSRTHLRILVSLLTGHADLNRHMTITCVFTDPLCPLCQEDEETVLHLLRQCPALISKHVDILFSHFYARQHICYSAYMPWQFRLSVCLSVTRVDQSKTVEARITQFSPYSSPIPLVCAG